MASKFQSTVVSNEYVNAVADSAATGKPIAYSGVVASSTVFTDEQLKTLDYSGSQSANKEITSVVTSSYLKQGSNTIVIEVNLSNENLSTDFQWASVLIYATYNGNNILVAVLRLVTPELFPAYDGKSIVSVGVDLFISVDKTSAANISVNGAGYATMDTVNKLRNYVDNDFNATIIRSDKDGVLNGSYSFAKAINALAGINGTLNTRLATFTDFADVAKNMFKYAGNWFVNGNVISNKPNVVNYLVVIITPANFQGSGKIEVFEFTSGKHYEANVANSILGNWKLLSDDSTVLHKTGDENADGIKTFIKQIIAQAGVKGNLQGNADTATKLATARKIGGQPFDGTSDVTLPGVNATGNQDTTGNAASATTAAGSDKLNTGRNISVTGDVTAPAQKFDGTKDLALVASLPAITRSDTSSSSSVGYGGTITVIDSVVTDSKGRITGLNVSKIAIPDSQTSVTGNAGSATRLQTARKIGGVSFDGTQDIDLAGVNKTGNQDTTGNAASAKTLLTQDIYGNQDLNNYVTNGIFSISGASVTNSPIDTNTWLTLVVFRNLEKSKVTVSQLLFGQLSNNIYTRNLLGTTWTNWVKLADDSTLVHNTGSENVSGAKNFYDVLTALSGIKGDVTGSLKGNADTATKLATARTIGGVSFDGTTNINLPGVNTAGNQNTSGKAATAGRADTAAKADSATTANDPNALHQTGNETATGIKNFQGQLITEVNAVGSGGFFMRMAADGNDPRQIIWSRSDVKNDSSGAAIGFGAGGLTIIGGGEAATSLLAAIASGTIPAALNVSGIAQAGPNETAVVVSDGRTVIGSSYQNGGTAGQFWIFNLDGTVSTPDGSTLAEDNDVVHTSGTETIDGTKNFKQAVKINNSTSFGDGSIELSGNINYIDFHYGKSTSDYTSRIIEQSNGQLSFVTATGIQTIITNVKGNLTGNADTATKLATPRTINGTQFDGTQNISVNAANDSNLVHKTGDESASGTKTFTGTLVANNPITGTLSIAYLTQKDLNNATVSGRYKIDTTYSNIPMLMPNSAFIDVMNFDDNLIYQVIVSRDISGTVNKATIWTRTKISGDWGDWESIAKDGYVVHNIGNETVSGDKNFTDNTGLNTVTTTKLQDTTITVNNLNMRFIETSLGVNVLASGSYQGTADGSWTNIGKVPSNITLPLMPVVMNSAAAAGIGGVSLREGFTVFIRVTETGSIDVRYTTFKSNDNKQYSANTPVDNSMCWIK